MEKDVEEEKKEKGRRGGGTSRKRRGGLERWRRCATLGSAYRTLTYDGQFVVVGRLREDRSLY